MADPNIDYNSFFIPIPSYVPGAFLDGIELSNYTLGAKSRADYSSNLGLDLAIDYHTYFVTNSSLEGFSRYFNGGYKMSVFYMTSLYDDWEGRDLSYRVKYTSLFGLSKQRDSGVTLVNTYEIPNFARADAEKIIVGNRRVLHKADMPRISFSCPKTSNLTVFIVPFCEKESRYRAPEKNILSFGEVVEEKILIRNKVQSEREKFYVSSGKEWPRPAAVHQDGRQYLGGLRNVQNRSPVLRRAVVRNDKLTDFLVIDNLSELLTKTAHPEANDDKLREINNVNYFSNLFLSKDLSLKLNGLFGVDVLSILKNNSVYSSIFKSSNLDKLRRYLGQADIDIKIYKKSFFVTGGERVIASFAAKHEPIHVSTSDKTKNPFVRHYSFEDLDPDNFGTYEINLTLNLSKLTRNVKNDILKLDNLIKVINETIPKTNRYNRYISADYIWGAGQKASITKKIINIVEYYSDKTISANKKENYFNRLTSLLASFKGRYMILNFTKNLRSYIKDIYSSMKLGSTFSDRLSTGAIPTGMSGEEINNLVKLTKKYTNLYDVADNLYYSMTSPIGADYVSLSKDSPVVDFVVPGEQIMQRMDSEERRYFLDNQDFISSVENMTNKKFGSNLNLNLQRYSYLAPSTIMTNSFTAPTVRNSRGSGNQIEIISDTIENLDDKKLMVYNYILTLYKSMQAHLSNAPIHETTFSTLREISNVPFRMERSANVDYDYQVLKKSLEKYFSLTRGLKLGQTEHKKVAREKDVYMPDEPSDSAVPQTNRIADNKRDSSSDKIDLTLIMLSLLSYEIFNDGGGLDVNERFDVKEFFRKNSYSEMSELPKQIKALIKYFSYIIDPPSAEELQEPLVKSIISILTQDNGIRMLGYLYVNFFNLKEMQVFDGYETTIYGDAIMNKPKFSKVNNQKRLLNIPAGQFAFCKLADYKNQKFNIPETPDFPTYNKYFLVSRPTATVATPGTTTGPASMVATARTTAQAPATTTDTTGTGTTGGGAY